MGKKPFCRSVLRVHSAYASDKMREELLSVKELSAAFDGALVFVGGEGVMTHDPFSPARTARFVKAALPLAAGLKGKSLSVGWNLLSTIGHHAETPDPAMDGMDFMQFADGTKNRGALCPSSKKTLAYIAEVYALLSQNKPDLLFSDDDLSYGAHCRCERCLAEFRAFSGLEFADNAALDALFSSPDRAVRERARKAWLDYYRFKINRIFAAIVSAVSKNAPSAAAGFMTCVLGSDGMGAEEWCKTLAANGGAVYIRPGGGLYTDQKTDGAIRKAHFVGRQAALAESAVSLAEIENFPYQALRKSPKYTVFEAMCYVAAGCDGVAYNILPYSGGKEEYEPFIREIAAVRPFLEEVETFSRGTYGVGWGLERAYAEDAASPEWRSELSFADDLFDIGFPPAYRTENTCVFLLNGRYASALSDGQIADILSKGVFLDADALDVLNARGFGADTGFETAGEVSHCAAERDLAHPWNDPHRRLRDVRLEFSANNHPEFSKAGRAAVLKKRGGGGEFLTEIVTYGGEALGGGCGVFENARGGRVCAGGYAPFTWCYTAARKTQLVNVFQWLSKGALPGCVTSFHKVSFFARKAKNGLLGGVLLNGALQDAENVRVELRSEKKAFLFVCCDGGKLVRRTLTAEKSGEGLRTALVPRIPAFSAGLILEKEE